MKSRVEYLIILFLIATQLHAMDKSGKLVWGTSAAHLGSPYAGTISFEDMVKNKNALTLKQFYRIGGENIPATPTECKMVYTTDTLFVLFCCQENNMSFPTISHGEEWFSLVGSPVEQDASFPDKTDLFLFPSTDSSCYYQFSATADGKRFGCKFNTPQVLQDADGLIPQRKYEKVIEFDAVTVRKEHEWYTFLKIPWKTIGGKPEKSFGVTPVRTRWRNSEVSSPVAMDYSDRPVATDLFIEAHFGKRPQRYVYDEIVCKLPSGRLRWQRPAVVTYPNKKIKKDIWTMQGTLRLATTRGNLSERLNLLQNWVNLMDLEGFNFGSTRGSLPLEDMYVYLVRKKINKDLLSGHWEAVCKSVDMYLAQLDQVSGKWFADGSPGNIRSRAWTSLTEVETIAAKGAVSALRCRAENRIVNLYLSLPESGGVRLYSDKEGFFIPAGLKPLQFQQVANSGTYAYKDRDQEVIITGKPFSISFRDSSGNLKLKITDIAFHFTEKGDVKAIDFRTDLKNDESIVGFGEKFDQFDQNGKIVTLWGMDDWLGLTTGLQNQSYKPIPVFHSTKGYMIFINSSYRLRADVGRSSPGQLRVSQHGDILDYYFWIGEPERALQSYTSLTGKPVLPPKWAFEPWMGRTGRGWRATALDPVSEKKRVMRRFEELDIPHSAIYAEGVGAEMPDLHTFASSRETRVLSWYYPAIDPKKQRELMPETAVGSLPILHVDNPNKLASRDISYVDFTHPNARELSKRWWKLRLDLGVAGSMIDFGDRVPEDVTFYNGKKGDEMHNFYAYDYHRIYAEVFAERRGDDFILFGRSAAPGTQKWVAQFAGDLRANFRGLEGALNGLLSLSACGFSTCGSDLAGFRAWAEPDVYIRWTQFACFSPLMRSHGRVPKEPWEYGDEAVANYKKYAWVRENLLDYIYHSATTSHQSGIPMVRAMAMAFPGQSAVKCVSDQYMFGKDLMVCPVITDQNRRTISFPSGRWISLWDGSVCDGPDRTELEVPVDLIPVYMREGAIIPVRLNAAFRFGESMTHEQVKAFVLTLPKDKEHEVCFKEDQGVQVLVKRESDSFFVSLDNALDYMYLIVYEKGVMDICLDGKSLPQLKEKELESLPPGWYQDMEMNRVVIRLPRGLSKQVEIKRM